MKVNDCLLYLLPLLILVTGCDLEKDIDVDLPGHASQLVVECYLEPGKPIRATVLESSGYFDTLAPPLVPDAKVFITYQDRRIALEYKPYFSTTSTTFYTHSSDEKVKGRPGDIYSLEVTDGQGRKITAFTKILPAVPIDTIEWSFNEEEEATVRTSFEDSGNTENYYRYMVHRNRVAVGTVRDLLATDNLRDGKRISFGSPYDFRKNDTLVVSLFNIEKQYYDFFSSVSDAKDANGNPFAQPSRIKSAVEGGIGIFTNLAYDRKVVIIK
ncbi:uncharacterized protein DUF4249 [Pontibacter ummariensis]|uniref:DUF4249 domain-containing protein n=1 Tax=Pontibacter ummariensis TaxID=1610492 RepID=A0A239D6Z2_9BACT|nr:DUF4249 domain-containing protein [Pontibacter ummariensis]PRY14281.1 uncharacterized protein DUF4249 [Pontibacter ummariensis]SNS28100.1 protein of unknown function [Pontibacter ummariensis]